MQITGEAQVISNVGPRSIQVGEHFYTFDPQGRIQDFVTHRFVLRLTELYLNYHRDFCLPGDRGGELYRPSTADVCRAVEAAVTDGFTPGTVLATMVAGELADIGLEKGWNYDGWLISH